MFIRLPLVLSGLVGSVVIGGLLAGAIVEYRRQQTLIVHEWGTFTVLQDDDGIAVPGINVDDEPVPDFVHGFHAQVLEPQHGPSRMTLMKSLPPRHPDVTIRLETPVMYFYPPPADTPLELDVRVASRGGWLSEFYPDAEFDAPGLPTMTLSPDSLGTLAWKKLRVGTADAWPETEEEVWLSPRQVQAAGVTAQNGESERYLFYRGVGNYPAPLRVATDRQRNEISIRGQFGAALADSQSAQIGKLWLVHIRPGGALAYRSLPGVTVTADENTELLRTSSRFNAQDFAHANLDRLSSELHEALVRDGLFADEAHAMLKTWQHAYFQTAGLRLFFVVPRVWTDYRLPIEISKPARIVRSMVARIEMISPEQRRLLDDLKRTEPSDGKWIAEIPESASRDRFLAGRSEFGDLGVKIPADYEAYLDLGRFRNALVRWEARRTESPAISRFLNTYQLQEFPGIRFLP